MVVGQSQGWPQDGVVRLFACTLPCGFALDSFELDAAASSPLRGNHTSRDNSWLTDEARHTHLQYSVHNGFAF